MQHHRNQQNVGVENRADPVAVGGAADGRDEEKDEVDDQRQSRVSGFFQAPPEQGDAGVDHVHRK